MIIFTNAMLDGSLASWEIKDPYGALGLGLSWYLSAEFCEFLSLYFVSKIHSEGGFVVLSLTVLPTQSSKRNLSTILAFQWNVWGSVGGEGQELPSRYLALWWRRRGDII
jgi:hypothetical protein